MQVSLVLLNQSTAERRAVWERQLEALVPRVVAEIATPKSVRFKGDPVYGEYRKWVELACVWPRPEFKEPLLCILRGSNQDLIPTAAAGLALFHDPAIDAEIDRMREDRRYIRENTCTVIALGHRIAQEFDYRRKYELSMDDAAMTLAYADDSGQVVAFRWLIRYGIVLDTSRVVTNWFELIEDDRRQILRSADWIILGRERLRSALEAIFDDSLDGSSETLGFAELLHALALLDSPRARPALVKLLAQLNEADTLTRDRCQVLNESAQAFARLAQPRDAAMALQWLNHKDRSLRVAGVYVLAHIDSPEAFSVVRRYVAAYDGRDRVSYWSVLDVVTALSMRTWPNESYKWKYLRILSERLTSMIVDGNGKLNLHPEGHAAISLIRAMEHIAEVSLGPDGFINPGGFNRSTAASTALAWERWIAERQPANGE